MLSASVPERNVASRDEYLAANVTIVRDAADHLAQQCPDAVVVVATNPVDVFTGALPYWTGMPARRFMGFSRNDTVRLRWAIARTLGVRSADVGAVVLGEHGELQVPLLDRVTVCGRDVHLSPEQETAVSRDIQTWFSSYQALQSGRTSGWVSGVGLGEVVGALLAASDQPVPCSAMLAGEYGLSGVSLGVPVRLGRAGVREVVELALTSDQSDRLSTAAAKIESGDRLGPRREELTMRIVVLGAGAMGCLYGGLLAIAGQDVTLVDVSVEQIAAINARGLSLERAGGTTVVQVPAGDAAAAAARPGAPELVIVFTKTLHSRAALASAQPLLGPETWALTLQNGLGNVELIEEWVPRERIIQGITTFPSDVLGPARVRSLGEGVTRIMSADGTLSPQLRKVREALEEAGLHCETAPDVTVAIWEKVAFNAATNALTAVTGSNVGQLADSPDGREVARTVVGEVASVALRKGIAVREAAVLATLDDAFAHHRDHKPSMLQDMLRGRHTEIDALNGAVVREAAALGMQVPVTETLYHLVRAMEDRGPHTA